jgi:septal ring factor EnvC (AmiA/AmiB activator)
MGEAGIEVTAEVPEAPLVSERQPNNGKLYQSGYQRLKSRAQERIERLSNDKRGLLKIVERLTRERDEARAKCNDMLALNNKLIAHIKGQR